MSMDDAIPGSPTQSEPVEPRQAAAKPLGRLQVRFDPLEAENAARWIAKVEIYTRRFCADSMRTKGIFDRKQIQYNEYLIDNDIVNSSAMSQRTNRQESTPQVFINGSLIGGLRQVIELDRSGELDYILGLKA